MSAEQGDVETSDIDVIREARVQYRGALIGDGRPYDTRATSRWEERIDTALDRLAAALERAERELVDVEMDRRFQQDRARTAERELHEERERFHRHIETLIEPQLLARAEKAERALGEAVRQRDYDYARFSEAKAELLDRDRAALRSEDTSDES